MSLRPEVRKEVGGGAALGVPSFHYPPAVPLALTPTPVEHLERLSNETGVRLYAKRDDLTGLALTGNKVRKLEFLLSAAHDSLCDTVITCGGLQSNHARATAVAAVKLGLGCRLVLRGTPPERPEDLAGNLFLDRFVGATVRYITPDEWPRRDEIMHEEAATLQQTENRRCYAIPEGGSNALGAFGYIRCAEEIAQEEARSGKPFDYVVCATGSGGTQAGLVAGKALLKRSWRVLGFAVCDDRSYFRNRIQGILAVLATEYGLRMPGAEDEVHVLDGYKGPAYGIPTPDDLLAIREAAETEGLLLDPVYTGKAFHGLLAEIGTGAIPRGSRVLFVHTGGIFGLLARAADFGLSA